MDEKNGLTDWKTPVRRNDKGSLGIGKNVGGGKYVGKTLLARVISWGSCSEDPIGGSPLGICRAH